MIASNVNMLAAMGNMASEITLPGLHTLYCPVMTRDPKATGELPCTVVRRVASGIVSAQSSGISTRNGSGIGKPRSPARHAAITSLARLTSPSSQLPENFATTSTLVPSSNSHVMNEGLVRPLVVGRSNWIGTNRLSTANRSLRRSRWFQSIQQTLRLDFLHSNAPLVAYRSGHFPGLAAGQSMPLSDIYWTHRSKSLSISLFLLARLSRAVLVVR